MRCALVTGATDGIGLETARALHRLGWRILVHGRSERKASKASLVVSKDGDRCDPVWGDFSNFAEVVTLAEQVLRLCPSLDVLVNNAGIYPTSRTLSADGVELTMAVNHLAPFLLTLSLLPALQSVPRARIINVSSQTHSSAKLKLNDINFEKGWDAYLAYSNSKLANLLFTSQLAENLRKTNVCVNGLHPGVIGTKLLRASVSIQGADVSDGARTSVYLADDRKVDGVTGKYFVDCQETTPSAAARDKRLAVQLWEASNDLVADFV